MGLIEAALLRIVTSCFKNDDADETDVTHRALGVGFLSVEGFRSKMDFSEATVDRYLGQHHPGAREEWQGLVKRTWAASGHRNKIAHWAVNLYPAASPGPQILDHAARLQEKEHQVQEEIAFFLEGSEERYVARPGQRGPVPSIANLRDHILEELARLLRPSEQKA